MADAWGGSFGVAWGSSWGAGGATPPRGNAGPFGHGHGVRRTEADIRRAREKFGVLPKAQAVLEEIAKRQAEALRLDEQQRLEELHRELTLQGIEWDSRYLQALNDLRERRINAEIASLLKQKLDSEETVLLMLMAAASA